MSYHSNSINLQQPPHNDGNEHVYFSRITQQWEPVWFYATMLKKLSSFAQAIDRCAPNSRELVWSHIFSLYNQPNRKCNDLFNPIIDEWCHSQAIDLSAIEIMYTSFLQMYNQYPGLFEDMLAPASTPSDHSSLSYSGGIFADGKVVEFKKEDLKQKSIKLANTSLIWGNTFASSIQQFSLLLNWAPLLEKLPPNQKEAIWNTCQFFPLFAESFDRTSFRKTFLKWASNLYGHLSHITILFAAIGFLRDKGIIKHQFFYPSTTVPVFNNGAKNQPPAQYYPPSSPHPQQQQQSQPQQLPQQQPQQSQPQQQFSPSSPLSPTSSPSRVSSSPNATSRSPSPTSSGEFQSQPLHHFYPSLSGTSSHPVLPTIEGMRNPKLPFDSLSLPPLSLPAAASQAISSATPANAPGTSSSRLGLLALAAFQADDPEAPQPVALPPLAPLQKSSTNKEQDSVSIKHEHEVKTESRAASPKPTLPPPILPSSTQGTEVVPTPESQQPAPNSTPTTVPLTKDKIKQEPAMMKISKRKNSCSDYHDDESKRPRTAMNLSHILCS